MKTKSIYKLQSQNTFAILFWVCRNLSSQSLWVACRTEPFIGHPWELECTARCERHPDSITRCPWRSGTVPSLILSFKIQKHSETQISRNFFWLLVTPVLFDPSESFLHGSWCLWSASWCAARCSWSPFGTSMNSFNMNLSFINSSCNPKIS